MAQSDMICQAIHAWAEWLKGNPKPLKRFFEQTNVSAYSFIEMLREYQDNRNIKKLQKILKGASLYDTKTA